VRTDTPPALVGGVRRRRGNAMRRCGAAIALAAVAALVPGSLATEGSVAGAVGAVSAARWSPRASSPASAEARPATSGAAPASERSSGEVGSAASGPAGVPPDSGAATSMQLLAQTTWVGTAGMTMTVAIETALPASSLALNVVLYENLHTRSGFEESLGGPAAMGSVVLASPTMPLGELDTSTRRGGLESTVRLAVTPGFATTTTPVSTLSLGCSVDTCDGVYPMQVQLLDLALGNKVLTGFTTYLVYAASEVGIPLDVGLVLPLGIELALGPNGAAAIGDDRLDGLESLLGALEEHAGVPVDFELHSQLALALARDRSRLAHAVLTRLRVLVGQRSALGAPVHELLAAPFAPADPGTLTNAGLAGDVAAQLSRGTQSAHQILGTAADEDALVVADEESSAALAAVAAAGVSRLVVPAAEVDATPVDGNFAGRLTLEPPAGGSGPTFQAFAADPGLAPFFETTTADPVLAAQQLLAELAMIYFEAPNAPVQRSVVIAPVDWDAGPAFADTLLSGLAASTSGPQPLARGVQLSSLFSLPPATGYSPAAAHVAPGHAAGSNGLGPAVQQARHAVRVLDSIAPAEASRHEQLADDILLSEAAGLSPGRRSAYLATAPAAVLAEGRSLRLPGGDEITLTSTSGSIPITIDSSAGTEIWVVVRLSSGSGITALSPPEKVGVRGSKQVTLRVGARTSGVFGLRVDLTAPLGGAVLMSKPYRVVSTAVSPVAIALSVGAVLVLLAWWMRSSRRRRRDGASAGQPGVPAPPTRPAV
jgi:hypothetical protein